MDFLFPCGKRTGVGGLSGALDVGKSAEFCEEAGRHARDGALIWRIDIARQEPNTSDCSNKHNERYVHNLDSDKTRHNRQA